MIYNITLKFSFKLCEKKAKNAQKTGQVQGLIYPRRSVTYKMSIIYLYRGHQELSINE